MTRERPILFNGAMVRAILAGTKTQTRRPMKVPPRWVDSSVTGGHWMIEGFEGRGEDRQSVYCGPFDPVEYATHPPGAIFAGSGNPHGIVGDTLWVRETVAIADRVDDGVKGFSVGYRADGFPGFEGIRWTPSIHMPRWAARIFLRVTDVRVERLQDISEEDAIAEGSQMPMSSLPIACRGAAWNEREVFARLWNDAYGAGAWDANPWVWATTFERKEAA